MESPCISQLQTQEKQVVLVNFLEKYYFLQNGLQWGTSLFEKVFCHLAYVIWGSNPTNACTET